MRKISDLYSPDSDDAGQFDFMNAHDSCSGGYRYNTWGAYLYSPSADDARQFDFVNVYDSDSGEYRYNTWEAYRCQSTGSWIGSTLQGEAVEYLGCFGECDMLDPTSDQQQQIDDNEQTPVVSYWWPMGRLSHMRDEWEAAWWLRHLPVVLVEVDGIYGVAPTGGGMDMSWYLAAAFVECGFMPPLDLSLCDCSMAENLLGKSLARRTRNAYHETLLRAKRRLNYLMAEVRTWH